MWEKIKLWLEKAGKAVRQFLRYAYASQISYLTLSVLFYFLTSKFFGIILFAWGVILLVAEIRQQKAEKIITP